MLWGDYTEQKLIKNRGPAKAFSQLFEQLQAFSCLTLRLGCKMQVTKLASFSKKAAAIDVAW
jgi:hypothetical protein